MKENKESVKEALTKVRDSFTLKQFAMVGVVVFGMALYILFDYISLGFDASIFRDPAYWIQLAIGQSAVTIMMLTMYNFTADKEQNNNPDVIRLRQEIYRAHCLLIKYGLSDRFDEYVYEKNIERKKKAYTAKMERKLFKTKDDKRRKQLQSELDRGLEIIESINVRYKRIRMGDIFSRAVSAVGDDEDLSDGKAQTTATMLLNKILGIIFFGVLLSTIVPSGKDGVLLATVLSSFIKLFQGAYAVYSGGSTGVAYVRGRLLTSLDNRVAFIQKFLDKNAPSVPGEQIEERTDKPRSENNV